MATEVCLRSLCLSPYWLIAAGLSVGLVGLLLWRFAETEIRQIAVSVKELFSPLWRIYCWIYIIPWRVWWYTRLALVRAIIAFVTLVSALVVLESALILVHHNKEIAKQLGPSAEKLAEQLGVLPDLPLWVEVSALPLAVILVWHHVNEWLAVRRNAELPQVLGSLTREMWNAPAFSSLSEDGKQKRFNRVMEGFRKALEHKRRLKISASLLVPGKDGLLAVTMTHVADAGPQFDTTVTLRKGEGCAGLALAGAVEAYVPSVKHLIVINVRSGKPLGIFMRKSAASEEPFQTVYCAPVADRAQTKIEGVLTFAGRKPNAFGPADHEILRLAGVYVSLLFFD